MKYINLTYVESHRLANALVFYTDYYGVTETELICHVLSGEVSVEEFVEEVENLKAVLG